ncbi:MAG: cation:proton antiporter [Alphaproteobacteria bacterium]|nr:cation:proton antiporter [Alphaproteobacteria bacterium]
MESLSYLAIIWGSVFAATFLSARTRLTPVLYFLAVGAVLVNTGILPVEGDPFIRGFADIGIIVIMFALGFEENSSHFVRALKRSWGIAFFGGIVPFFAAYMLADYFWNDVNISLICGLAMISTAVSLTMVSLKSEGLQTSPVARGIMTSAVIEDIASLVLVAIMIPVATGQAALSASGIGLIAGKTVLFFALITVLGLWIFPHKMPDRTWRIPLLGHYGIRDVLSFGGGEQTTLILLLIALLTGILAHEFGFHPAVGAYMAGLIFKEDYFHFLRNPDGDHYQNTKKIIDSVAFSWIGPVFFVNLGTKILFDWDIFVSVIPHVILMTLGLIVAQVSSSALAAYYTGSFKRVESLMIGFGMLGRAELAFVVMDIAYVQHDILSTEAFYTLMFTAFWLNVCVPLSIRFWKPYLLAEQQALTERTGP